MTIFQSLKREIRYTKFDVHSLNASIMTIYEASIKQYNDKQILSVRGRSSSKIYHIDVSTYAI